MPLPSGKAKRALNPQTTMGVTTFESSVKSVPYAPEVVYAKLADLNNLGKLKEALDSPDYADRLAQAVPADKLAEARQAIESMSFDSDNVSITSPMGNVRLTIVDREAPKLVKLVGEGLPIALNLWIQLLPHDNGTASLMKVTIKADLNIFIKSMVSKPLKQGVEKMAEILAALPYGV